MQVQFAEEEEPHYILNSEQQPKVCQGREERQHLFCDEVQDNQDILLHARFLALAAPRPIVQRLALRITGTGAADRAHGCYWMPSHVELSLNQVKGMRSCGPKRPTSPRLLCSEGNVGYSSQRKKDGIEAWRSRL